jgi:hypothetical protein
MATTPAIMTCTADDEVEKAAEVVENMETFMI